jgi:hypothetical protein
LRARGRRRARQFSAARMADGHRQAFEEAARVYSPHTFLWRRWVTGYWHRARLEWRWRAHHRRTIARWISDGRRWIDDPAG